jgi:hypothetical protein
MIDMRSIKKLDIYSEFEEQERRLRKHAQDRKRYRTAVIEGMRGPCTHPGCMSHVSHPCEGCGRQWVLEEKSMSNRTDWEALTSEIMELADDMHLNARFDALSHRIKTELHNAWVAGQEGSGAEDELNPRYPGPECNSRVESVKVEVVTVSHTEYGDVDKRFRKTIVLDPEGIICSQTQQFEREHGEAGDVVGHVKVGKPVLILHGKVVGGSNEPVYEDTDPLLQVVVEKVPSILRFRFWWGGQELDPYEVTEHSLMTEEFKQHVEAMIDYIVSHTTNLSRPQVHQKLEAACSNHFGAPL